VLQVISRGEGVAKREKMITLRINEESYRVLKDYATNHGLSVNAYLNSVIDSQAEWFIPTSSYDAVTVPKSMVAILFGIANQESLDKLAKMWAVEAKNIILLSGAELSVQSAVSFVRRVSKYFMGTDARITLLNKAGGDPSADHAAISAVIRHDAGENFSYFTSRSFAHLFETIGIRAAVDYDSTTVFIRIESS
jgi:hypothetical protein